MLMHRRAFCGAALAAGVTAAWPGQAAAPVTLTDLAGRRVQLPRPARRIVLLEARDVVTMALLVPDPVSHLVGWAGVDRIDSPLLQARFAQGRKIPVVGLLTPDSLSLESILQLAPDLVVASSYMLPTGGADLLVQRLSAAGIPVVYSDLSSHGGAGAVSSGVIANLHAHVRLWGDILGVPDRAAAFSALVTEHLTRVAMRLQGTTPVTSYLEIQSSLEDCCWAAGNQIWGELLRLAGGQTLAAVTEPWYQKLSLETLLTTPHDVYLASGGGWAAGGRPAIGPGLDAAQGREGLRRLTTRTGFSELASVRTQRVHGIWTGLISMMPLNVLFVERVATWLHPHRFPDLNPADTLARINTAFFAQPLMGPLWASLQE